MAGYLYERTRWLGVSLVRSNSTAEKGWAKVERDAGEPIIAITEAVNHATELVYQIIKIPKATD